MWYDMFWDDTVLNNTTQLKQAATVLVTVIERLELIQKMVKSKGL